MAYDKLETKNVFSPHFGECRGGWILLHHSDPDNTLFIGQAARQYKVRYDGQNVLISSAQFVARSALRRTGWGKQYHAFEGVKQTVQHCRSLVR